MSERTRVIPRVAVGAAAAVAVLGLVGAPAEPALAANNGKFIHSAVKIYNEPNMESPINGEGQTDQLFVHNGLMPPPNVGFNDCPDPNWNRVWNNITVDNNGDGVGDGPTGWVAYCHIVLNA